MRRAPTGERGRHHFSANKVMTDGAPQLKSSSSIPLAFFIIFRYINLRHRNIHFGIAPWVFFCFFLGGGVVQRSSRDKPRIKIGVHPYGGCIWYKLLSIVCVELRGVEAPAKTTGGSTRQFFLPEASSSQLPDYRNSKPKADFFEKTCRLKWTIQYPWSTYIQQ